MKKSKLLFLGLIALVLAGGLALAGCGPKCSNKGDCTLSWGAAPMYTPQVSTCDSTDCAVYKGAQNVQQNIQDLMNGKTPKYSCDC